MEKRTLGHSELEIAPLSFGGNVFGWTVDEATSFKLLDAFTAAGFNLIDTADTYSRWVPGNKGGESETIIGKWLNQSSARNKVLIATKVGMEMNLSRKGLSKAHIIRSAEESLQRLQTDHIDLYQSHTDDFDTPLEETFEAYSQLIKQGKVRTIGASNYSAARLSESLKIGKQHGYPIYQSLQTLYNLYDRAEYEIEFQPLCQNQGLGVITYFSLASGFLSGKYRSGNDLGKSARGDFVSKYLNDRGFRILRALDQIAKQYNVVPASISIAWLLARPGITSAIASATKLEQLHSLIEGTELRLDQSSMDLLNRDSAY